MKMRKVYQISKEFMMCKVEGHLQWRCDPEMKLVWKRWLTVMGHGSFPLEIGNRD